MTINDPQMYINSLWDWGCLNGCFGDTKIKPTDIDGFVERNGRFLIIETKLPTVEVPAGQEITFSRLINTGYFSIIIVWGNPNNPEMIKVITRKKEKIYSHTNIKQLRDIVTSWFNWANSKKELGK